MNNSTWTRNKLADGRSMTARLVQFATFGLLTFVLANTPNADYREQAKRIHDRLAGVLPSNMVLDLMEAEVDPGRPGSPIDAAYRAMDNPNFYNVTLKNFAAPWTNRDQNVFVPLNDYMATVIGMIRDDVPFNSLFSADILYVGPGSLPPYSNSDNNHYAQMEAQGIDMMSGLQQVSQSATTGLPPSAVAGIWTTRAAAEAFFVAGTNRAQFRFTMLNHLCNDMEQVHDVKRVPDRIRQDVSRSPGGDSRLFFNNCIGCHSGMDPLAGAFAYYDFNEETGTIEYTPGVVQPKYFNNDLNFPQGFRTVDDSWENRWREGQNAYLGFAAGPGEGNGAKSLGVELGNSEAFAACQVKKVFRAVCLRSPENLDDRNRAAQLTDDFRNAYQYDLKEVFAATADYCRGQ